MMNAVSKGKFDIIEDVMSTCYVHPKMKLDEMIYNKGTQLWGKGGRGSERSGG